MHFKGCGLSMIYTCEFCRGKMRSQRGCLSPFKRKAVWTIDECLFCYGEKPDKKCFFCKGRGKIAVRQCPRVVGRGLYLLPYFIAYKNSNGLAWPDGTGRLQQPLKLVAAFDVLSYYFDKLEAEQIEKDTQNAKKNYS